MAVIISPQVWHFRDTPQHVTDDGSQTAVSLDFTRSGLTPEQIDIAWQQASFVARAVSKRRPAHSITSNKTKNQGGCGDLFDHGPLQMARIEVEHAAARGSFLWTTWTSRLAVA